MIGNLSRRVTFQKPSLAADGAGGFTRSFINVTENPTVYAEIVPLSGGEALRFQQLTTAVSHRVTIRYRSDITPDNRIIEGAKTYDILAVIDREGNKELLDILTEERKP